MDQTHVVLDRVENGGQQLEILYTLLLSLELVVMR